MKALLAIGVAIGLIVGTLLTSASWLVYDRFVDNPRVAREAREQYVHVAEVAALQARQEADARRLENAQSAAQSHALSLLADNANLEEENARLLQENADYEAHLSSEGRRCALDAADIDWVRKP